MQVYRFRVVLFGSTASQFLLNSTIIHHLQILNTEVSNNILRNICIDNIQSSFDNESKLLEFYKKSKSLMETADFKLREWHTNSPSIKKIMTNNSDVSFHSNIKVL